MESVESLKHKVNEAKLRLDFTTIYLEEVHRDYSAGTIPPGDPRVLAHAIRARHLSLMEYQQALQIYQDFISPRAGAA